VILLYLSFALKMEAAGSSQLIQRYYRAYTRLTQKYARVCSWLIQRYDRMFPAEQRYDRICLQLNSGMTDYASC
jgi:hypothetical protein